MNLAQRSHDKELLDGEDIPFADIHRNMQELEVVNKWLGGHRITIKGFEALRNPQQPVHVCEIGCGGGDNLAALYGWCKQKKIEVQFTGIDIKPECITVAKEKPHLQACTTWIVSDYRAATFSQPPDIIFSSLFCHHFTDAELVTQLQWMKNHCTKGFFINDLQRHPLAYYSIRLLTRLFSTSYLVKHDAPLSVRRGFRRTDWQRTFTDAGLHSYSIQWQWAFRYLILYRHAQ